MREWLEFDQPADDIASRVMLLSKSELSSSLKRYEKCMTLLCDNVMPKLFGEGKYNMTSEDDGCSVIVQVMSDTLHPKRFASGKVVLVMCQSCPQDMPSMKHKLLYALACMFRSMFTSGSSRDDGHSMPVEGCWQNDSQQVTV